MFRLKLAALINKFRRRKGPTFRDQCMSVIMHVCSLQMDREEFRELAPISPAIGPMRISGGAITTIQYRVFDKNADKVDPKIRQESHRAFADVTMRISPEAEPEFQASIEGVAIEPKAVHTNPGKVLVTHLSRYFPLLPKPHSGPTFKPEVA